MSNLIPSRLADPSPVRRWPNSDAAKTDPQVSAWEEAETWLHQEQIAPAQHVLLQENVATGLTNLSEAGLGGRWGVKLKRDLKAPYTDRQVFDHVDELQESLKRNLEAIPAIPSQVYITGSFAKGRLGANSDLDAYIVLGPECRQLDLSPFKQLASDTGATVFPLFSDMTDYNRTLFLLTGSTVAIDPETLQQPGALRRHYAASLKDRGIEVDPDFTCHKVSPGADRRETHPWFEKVMDHCWTEEKTTDQKWNDLLGDNYKARTLRGAFALAGRLCQLPGVGPILEQTADFFVRQHHH